MLRQSAIAAFLLLVSSQAHAVCTQNDLKGSWRFEFNTGIVRSDFNRLRMMSCILNIKANGAIKPVRCDPVDSSGEDGGFVNPGNRKLRMVLKNCQVKLSGNEPELGLKWTDNGDTLVYHFENVGLSISKDRQAMSGWLSNGGKPIMAVTALKRARP